MKPENRNPRSEARSNDEDSRAAPHPHWQRAAVAAVPELLQLHDPRILQLQDERQAWPR